MDAGRGSTSNDPLGTEAPPLAATKTIISDEPGLLAQQQAAANAARLETMPERIGRYRIERVLGSGGFATVYLGLDEELQRRVAIKVPLPQRVRDDAEGYLNEARIVASLQHPNIVSVFDVGLAIWAKAAGRSAQLADLQIGEGHTRSLCYVVSQYIEGTNLRAQIVTRRYSPTEAADFVATIAGALHYAHKQGVVHRDIKPENILVDGTGKPYVADFGIALRDDDFGRGGENRLIGTPSYMSPEQSRGEGHLVDGRSDVFSLGIVLYELLTGVNPFRGANWADSVFKIAKIEVKPPRQINDALPRELERVCLRALAKRATDRYTTAKDFADDLRHFLADRPATDTKTAIVSIAGSVTQPDIRTPSSDSRTLKMVPKGLRSFDAQDADFFLELLPGPRDRDGLPDSIRFWKMRLEETDSDETFRVGLIYGPSGCGKSSLVKAGLLPRLAEHVLPIYIEATADETESRLLHGLLKRCPGLPPNPDLKTALAALRHGEGLPAGWKVLVILDQFEQWLHSKGKDHNSELIQALRQCDGGRVQCVVMVRDDFWMAVTRFLANLEVDLVQGRNFAAVDLFDLDHARRVLTACGRPFGRLPDRSAENSDEQHAFLSQAVSGLAEEGKVVCVRLALFAEMMKSRPWTPAALKQVGGTEGVGVTFLEETFSAPSANPKHRLHQTAARAVLAALLPESGSEIKGNMRSRAELLEISGLSSRPKEFADLIRILDGEIRLITPTDPEGIDPDKSLSEVEAARKYYQLTHDFLVPALREWLTRKQRETRRGRAELRLAERAATWKEKRENRHLPSLWEYANIRLLTNARNWKEPERKMMQRAGRVHGLRTAIVASVLLAVTVGGAAVSRHIEEKRQADFAAALVRRLIDADIAQVPAIVREIDGYRRWTDPLLRQEQLNAPPGSDKKLHVNLALLPVDRSKVSELESDLLSVPPGTFVVVRDSLSSEKDQVVEPLWRVALDARQESRPRFQAAAALASYASDDKRWSSIGPFVAGRLVAFEASPLVAWREALRPAKEQLLASLAAIFRDPRQDEQARRFAAETLSDYAPDRPDRLFDLLADAEVFQFPVLFEALAKPGQRDKAVQLAERELQQRSPDKATDDEKEHVAKRQTNAAVALLRMGTANTVWPLLKAGPDPRLRSYFINRLGSLGGEPAPLIQRLDAEPDVTIRRALVLAIGAFPETHFSTTQRQPLIEKLFKVFENEPDAGLHGAAEWLLRKWGQAKRLDAALDKLKSDEKQLQSRKSHDGRRWFVNMLKQTFVIVDGGEFVMGSPESEPERLDNEELHRVRIGRRFAIAAHEVSQREFVEIQRNHSDLAPMNADKWVKTDDSPEVAMTWYEAAAYCNWLSQREGIPKDQWCYEPNSEGKYLEGMKAKPKFWELTGYRLPTEAEWEYACRAGTVTARYFGESDGLLPNYAWCSNTSQQRTWPAASLQPNDLDLFDMLGNVMEWCFEEYVRYPPERDRIVDDAPAVKPVEGRSRRILRGGSFNDPASTSRSARRNFSLPDNRFSYFGFRVVRTFP